MSTFSSLHNCVIKICTYRIFLALRTCVRARMYVGVISGYTEYSGACLTFSSINNVDH